MANKKKIPARALACLLSTAMVPGSLPMDVLTVYGAEAEEFSDGKTSEADITPLDADAVDDAVETADFSSGSEVTADVVSEEASVDVQSADPNFNYTLSETEKTLKVGDTGSVSGTAMLNSNVVVPTAISYASSNSAVVAVDPSTGFYECKAEGIAAITATVQYKDPSSYTPKTYQTVKTLNITVTKDAEPQLNVTVKQPTVSVELDAKADAVEAYDLKNNVIVENAAAVTYKLTDAVTGNDADPSAATVDKTGLVTFKKAGKYVAAVIADGTDSTGTPVQKTSQVIFDVTKKTSAADDFTYEISELQRTHTVGESGSAAGTAFLGSQAVQAGVNYTSSDDSVVKVESDGTYKCLKAGTATVKVSATYNDTETGKSYARTINLVITVKDVDAPVVTANQTDVSLELDAIDGATAKYNLRSILSVENGDLSNVTYESSDKTNAKVENGTATFSKAGEYKVRAYIGSSSVTINFHITKKGVPAPIITANQTDVSLELDSADNAEVSYNLKSILSVENGLFVNVNYESSDETNAKVVSGTATFKKAGEYTVRAYIESSSVTINFHITKKGIAAPTITANQTDVDIELGATEAERVYNLKSILNLTDAEWTDVDIQSSDATNAEINSTDGTVKVKEAGEYTVKATVTTKGGSQSVTVNFHVTREAAAKPAITAKQKEVNITLASGKTVTYNLKANFTLSNLDWTDVDIQSSDATNAAVNPTEGTVTFSKVGYYTVTAVEKTSAATSDIIIFHVTSAVQEAGASISGGQNVQLSEIGDAFNADKTLTVMDFDGTKLEHGSAGVVWTSDNEAVATVKDGVIVAVGQGTAVITATLPNGNYTTYTVTVAPAQISAEISTFDVDLNDKNLDPEDYNLSTLLTVKNAKMDDVVYSDFNQNIIQVDVDGLVTFTGKTGTTYVRAQIKNTDAYVIITFNVTDSATPDPITINYAPGALQNIEVKEGQAYEKNLRDFIEVKQGSAFTDLTNVTWSSNDDSVAKVDNGVVTGVKAGTAVITATTVDGYYVTFTVTVKNAMKLNATQTTFAVDMKDNKTVDLNTYLNITNPETKPGTADEYTLDDVTYTTSTDEIAEVTGGKVTFKKTGLAEVKADLNGQTVTFTFIIKDTTAPLPVEINFKANAESTVEVAEGKVFDENLRDRVELTNGGDTRDITWTSLDESIASVSNGMVRGVKAGETTVIASTKDGYYVTFKVTVIAEPKMEVSQTEFDIDRAEQTSLDLKAYLKLLNTTTDQLDTDVTYTASADEIASVGPDGVVTFNGTGTTNVKAEYKGQVITFTFHITDSTTPDPVKIDYTATAEKLIEVTEGEAYPTSLADYIELTKGGAPADITSVTWSSNDDSVAKVDGGVVTGLKPGTAVITATTVDGYYVTFTVKVNPKALANVALKAPGTNVINLTLDSAVNASKDLSELVESTTVPTADVKGFTWSSDNTDVAVAANGTVKAVNPGLAMVTVTAPDGSSVSFIVSVSAGSFDQTTLTADNLKQIVLQLNVTDKETAALPEIKSDGGVVTWKVLDTDIARIAGNKVEGLKAGHTVAVATAPDGSSVGVSVKVLAEPVVTVKLTGQDEISLKMGQDETHDLTKELTVDLIGGLTAPGLGGSAPAVGTNSLLSQLTWTCSDESVVKVYSGVAVAQSAGVAVVTATAPDGSMAVFTITVDAEDISSVQLKAGESNIVNLILDGSDDESHKDLAKLVEDTVLGADPATFNWVSADKTIATVSHGVVRAQAVGNTTVTVTAPDGSKVVFIVAVSAGGFKPGYEADWEATLQVGVADKMSKKLPTVEATAGKVTWSCADESIAKITGDSVTAVAPGITYVIAKAPNGSELAFKVTVYASPAISFDKDSVSVPTGEVVQANVAVDPEDAAVDYEVKLDGNLAAAGTDYTLSVNGKKISFVPLAAGRFVITATAEVNSETATAQLVVTAQQEVEKVAFTEDKRNLFVGDTDDLLSLIQWNDGLSTPYDTSLTWSTGNASVATVDDTGVVTATGVGRTYVYAKASNGLRAKILVIVDAKVEGVTLSQENYELWVNEIAFIKATPNPANAKYTKVEYTSDDDTIATVSTDGRIVAKKGGTTYITATITWTDADGNNQTASARAKVFVKTPVKSVEVRRVDTDTNDDIYAKKRGETIQLKAVITPAEAYDKALTWSSENEDIATVDQNGKVTTVGKGTTYIYAKCMNGTYGTDGNGTPAVGMIKIIVGAEDDIQLDITPTRSEVYPGENVQYTTTLTPEEAYAGELTWSSDNSDVVIDSTGVAMVSKTAKAGLANITATMTFADGTTETAKALLYIKTDVNSLKFEKDAMTIYLDEDDYLSPIFNDGATTPSDTSITWTSDDSSIVSVDSYGKIHANKLGTTWISAYSYNKLRAQMLVKVIAAPTGVKLSEEVISGFAGERNMILVIHSLRIIQQRLV
ncbi:MAG: Ig domain-containing protein [Blautia sp.]